MTARQRSIEVPGLSHNAPIPMGARVGPLLCSSAISGKDPASGQLSLHAEVQVAQAFANMLSLLQAAGAVPGDVVKLTIYVKDNSVREAINAQWQRHFPDPQDRPARHILVHDLQHGMWLQLELTAFIQQAQKDIHS
jgi:2-iminobutanoate/2-iminopropanoate deaminase